MVDYAGLSRAWGSPFVLGQALAVPPAWARWGPPRLQKTVKAPTSSQPNEVGYRGVESHFQLNLSVGTPPEAAAGHSGIGRALIQEPVQRSSWHWLKWALTALIWS
jgi:hypothetical protein